MNSRFVESAIAIDEREAKLPAWARDKLSTLRRAATEARNELMCLKQGTEPSPFWIGAWEPGQPDFFLPTSANGRLYFGDPAEKHAPTLYFKANGDWLDICSRYGHIQARPLASNVLSVRGMQQ